MTPRRLEPPQPHLLRGANPNGILHLQQPPPQLDFRWTKIVRLLLVRLPILNPGVLVRANSRKCPHRCKLQPAPPHMVCVLRVVRLATPKESVRLPLRWTRGRSGLSIWSMFGGNAQSIGLSLSPLLTPIAEILNPFPIVGGTPGLDKLRLQDCYLLCINRRALKCNMIDLPNFATHTCTK